MMSREIVTSVQEGYQAHHRAARQPRLREHRRAVAVVGSEGFGTEYRLRGAESGQLDGDPCPWTSRRTGRGLGARAVRATHARGVERALEAGAATTAPASWSSRWTTTSACPATSRGGTCRRPRSRRWPRCARPAATTKTARRRSGVTKLATGEKEAIMATFALANAPCSWGISSSSGDKASRSPTPACSMRSRDTGYTGTELGDWGYMPTDPRACARSSTGGGWPAGRLRPGGPEGRGSPRRRRGRGAQDGAAAGRGRGRAGPISCSPTTTARCRAHPATPAGSAPRGLTRREWNVFAAGAKDRRARCDEETGLGTVFHHHCAGYVETPDEIARFSRSPTRGLVGLCLDTGHYAYGGGTRRGRRRCSAYGERIRYVHFKDCQPEMASRAPGRRAGLLRGGARRRLLRAGQRRGRLSRRCCAG